MPRSLWRPSFPFAAVSVLTAGIAAAAGIGTPANAASIAQGGAALAFARFTAGQTEPSPWKLETIEIDASLPKLEEQGRLRAIRRLLPFGHPAYQVLEVTGDRTVKEQVIIRYLKADERASEIPALSVAIIPANYKFNYKGPVAEPGGVAYVFQITPRKKRDGLIKGELWLDGATGVPLRESGYLVKRPSLFLKKVRLTRESLLRDGVVEARITHVSIDARFVGRAELVIEERPVVAAQSSPPAGEEQQ